MGIRRYNFNTPNQETLNRFLEIRFQLFMENYLGKESRANTTVLENLCLISNVDYHEINQIYSRLLLGVSPRQESEDKAIYIAYMSYLGIIPQRYGLRIANITSRLLYNLSQEYIDNGQPGLPSLLDAFDRETIKNFLDNMEKFFELSSFAVRGV